MNRRELIQRVAIGGAVLVLAPTVLSSCSKDTTTDPPLTPPPSKLNLDLSLPAYSGLNSAGGSVVTQNVIIINTGGGNYVALSSVCTHQGCTVGYNSGAGNIQCPCHGSVYTTAGVVINGPAPLPLTTYPVSLSGNVLSISR
jgi:cytochrome b6-f complex iron-sulfur subunit